MIEPSPQLAPGTNRGLLEQGHERAPDVYRRLDVPGRAPNEIRRMTEIARERADVSPREIRKEPRGDRVEADRVEREILALAESLMEVVKKRQLESGKMDDGGRRARRAPRNDPRDVLAQQRPGLVLLYRRERALLRPPDELPHDPGDRTARAGHYEAAVHRAERSSRSAHRPAELEQVAVRRRGAAGLAVER